MNAIANPARRAATPAAAAPVSILYCGDENIEDGVLVSALSLLANQPRPFHAYIATAEVHLPERTCLPVSQRFVQLLDRYLAASRPGCGATLIDASRQFRAAPPVANLGTRFTPLCMLRLYTDQMPQLNHLQRVLYLDNDVLCLRPLDELCAINMGNAQIAGALDRYGKWLFHSRLEAFDYLNSGVLLMNMNALRASNLLGRCRELCASKRMFMPDQSALNKLARNKLVIPRRFNEQHLVREDTVLQHFSARFSATGLLSVKPWQVEEVHERLHIHDYDDVLASYLALRDEFIEKQIRKEGDRP